MVKVDDISKEVSISRGDTAMLTFDFDGDIPPNGTTCVITIKEHLTGKQYVLAKTTEVENAQVSFEFAEEDTMNLSFGTYYYDLRLFYVDGSVVTPITPTAFRILSVVGNN